MKYETKTVLLSSLIGVLGDSGVINDYTIKIGEDKARKLSKVLDEVGEVVEAEQKTGKDSALDELIEYMVKLTDELIAEKQNRENKALYMSGVRQILR